MNESYFSKTYEDSRRRFRQAASSVGATLSCYPIEAEAVKGLTIDVAIVGDQNSPTVMTSSGVHGIEGFFGAAAQLAILDRLGRATSPPNVCHVLVHAINPFGFSQLRRFNEENVDLNRNFIADQSQFTGAPEGYARLNDFLNPASPPSRTEPYHLKAAWYVWQHGLAAIKNSVAGGQYEFPRGLFFGGHHQCQSTRIVCENCDRWVAGAKRVVHIDFHTGLGRFGTYKLLLTRNSGAENLDWYKETFGETLVEPFDTEAGTAYKTSGLFGEWMQDQFGSADYRFAVAEFGTHPITRVFGSLRAENRAHHYGEKGNSLYQSAKAEILECFCPSRTAWRTQTIASSLEIIDQATSALIRDPW
jgi:hypothetical protein